MFVILHSYCVHCRPCCWPCCYTHPRCMCS